MDKSIATSACLVAVIAVALSLGCRVNRRPIVFDSRSQPLTVTSSDRAFAQRDDEFQPAPPTSGRTLHEHAFSHPPLTSADALPPGRELTVAQAIELALQNTEILRSLNAQVLTNATLVAGVMDPAIQATDPIFGTQAALAQFDSQLSGSLLHANNDDVFNNSILGGGATEVVQDLTTADMALRRIGTEGTQYAIRSNVRYDSNNNPASIFPSSYFGFWEAQVRKPLLQGNGAGFNQIAGPNAQPGFRNTSGLLISKINNDISVAQFERELNRFLNELIEAYWALHFAYRNFEAATKACDNAQQTWDSVRARFENDLTGGEADKEAQAREQYYFFEQQRVTAINGDVRSGSPGVLQAEANLRRLLGLPQNDGYLLQPVDAPLSVKTVYQWNSLVNQALDARVEVREQLWRTKRRELELVAARNFLLPRLDAVATYRNNGFGDDLIGTGPRFRSVLQDMSSGDHDEWEMGVQFNVPVGYRQAHAAVRNAELSLQRERAVLQEQERQIMHDLGSAVRQTEQYAVAVELNSLRLKAAQDTVRSRQAAYDADAVTLDLLLDAERRLSEAEAAYERARVDLHLANEAVLRESGSFLASHAIGLSNALAGSDGLAKRCQPRSILGSRLARASRLPAPGSVLDYRSR